MTSSDGSTARYEIARAAREEARARTALIEARAAERLDANHAVGSDVRREFRWFGPITMGEVSAGVDILDRWSQRDPGEPINMTFCSPGGDVTAGFALYDFLLDLRARGHFITTRGTGMVASMASVLLQAGDKRILHPRSMVLIHEISGTSQGRMTELEIEMSLMRKMQAQALDILAERAKVKRATIASNWKKGDWWLTAQEAVDRGFADEVA